MRSEAREKEQTRQDQMATRYKARETELDDASLSCVCHSSSGPTKHFYFRLYKFYVVGLF